MGIRSFCLAAALLAAYGLPAHAQYKAQLIEKSKAWGTAIADYDGDGHDDIYITGHDSNDRIWHWRNGTYVASPQVLKWQDRHDCDAADVNRDGRMDFYCAVGADKGTGSGPNEMWIQQPDGTHVNTSGFGVEDLYGRSRMVKFFDFNRDGYPDIFLTNLPELRDDGAPNVNRVFVNQAGLKFEEATTLATGMFGAGCVDKGDIDQDGWDDLLVCSETSAALLYRNDQAGNFTLVPMPTAAPLRDAKLKDMNGDGRDDLVLLTNGNVLQIWFNSGTGAYFDRLGFESPLGVTAPSLAVGDFTGDGVNDVYVVLRGGNCTVTGRDSAADVVFKSQPGGGWRKTQLTQKFAGCGHRADVVDGSKVLLLNGGGDWKGPSYVITIQ